MRAIAAVARRPGGRLEQEEIELDDPRDDEIVLEVAACGVCHTDAKAREGYGGVRFPIVLGHEGAGTVLEVGRGVTGVGPGDKVLLVSDYCGRCPRCRAGDTAYCEEGPLRTFGAVRPDGSTRARAGGEPVRASFFGQSAFATHALANERNALKVAPDAELELLAAMPCGMVTGAGAVLEVLRVAPGTRLAVLGTGTVGLAAVMAAAAASAGTILAVDRHPARLELARRLGATDILDADGVADLAGALRERTGGCDAILDTTGLGRVQLAAVEALATRGTLGIVGGGDADGVPLGRLMVGGKTVRGIIQGDASGTLGLEALLRLHAAGRFPFEALVRTYPFAAVNEAIEDGLAGTTVKAVLTF